MKNFIFAMLIVLGGVAIYRLEYQPKHTYDVNEQIQINTPSNIIKEEVTEKLENENNKVIQEENIKEDNIKEENVNEGKSVVYFDGGEIEFNYNGNKISGKIDIKTANVIPEFEGLNIEAIEGKLKVKKDFVDSVTDNVSVSTEANISCDNEQFISAVKKYAGERTKESFGQLLSCLEIEHIKYNNDKTECTINGGLKYPDFVKSTDISCKFVSEDEVNINLSIQIADKSVVLNLSDDKVKMEISGNLLGNSKENIDFLLELYEDIDEKIDYETVLKFIQNIEVTSAKITNNQINCKYKGAFKYPQIIADSHMDCEYTLSGDMKAVLSVDDVKNMVFNLIDVDDKGSVKFSMDYKLKDDELSITNTSLNGEMSITNSFKGLNTFLAENLVEYLDSAFLEEDNQKLILGFLKKINVSGSKSVVNGKTVSKFDGSFNLLKGVSGTYTNNIYLNDNVFLTMTAKGRYLNIKAYYPLTDKPMATMEVKFKKGLKKKYAKVVNTLVQGMLPKVLSKSYSDIDDVVRENVEYFEDIFNIIDSTKGVLFDENYKRVIGYSAKIKPGAELMKYIGKSYTELDNISANVYTYKANKLDKTIVIKDGAYVDGKKIPEDELVSVVDVEQLMTIFGKLGEDYEKVSNLVMQDKATIIASPLYRGFIIGGIAGYSQAMNKYNVSKTMDQVSMLVTNIRTLYSSQPDYGGLNNYTAKRFGVVPSDMNENDMDNSITNAHGGKVTIKSAKAQLSDSKSSQSFIIEYSGLSQKDCVTLATGDWGSGNSGLIGIAAGINKITYDGEFGSLGEEFKNVVLYDDKEKQTAKEGLVIAQPNGSIVSTPITQEQALEACSGGVGNTYGVAWKYY